MSTWQRAFIKIDKSFVRGLGDSKLGLSIVKNLISFSREIGIEVVAEGIEERWQFEALKKMKCDYFQGFLFSKPVNSEEITCLYNRKIPFDKLTVVNKIIEFENNRNHFRIEPTHIPPLLIFFTSTSDAPKVTSLSPIFKIVISTERGSASSILK